MCVLTQQVFEKKKEREREREVSLYNNLLLINDLHKLEISSTLACCDGSGEAS